MAIGENGQVKAPKLGYKALLASLLSSDIGNVHL